MFFHPQGEFSNNIFGSEIYCLWVTTYIFYYSYHCFSIKASRTHTLIIHLLSTQKCIYNIQPRKSHPLNKLYVRTKDSTGEHSILSIYLKRWHHTRPDAWTKQATSSNHHFIQFTWWSPYLCHFCNEIQWHVIRLAGEWSGPMDQLSDVLLQWLGAYSYLLDHKGLVLRLLSF